MTGKIDCTLVENFIKEFNRLCDSVNNNCFECFLSEKVGYPCHDNLLKNPKKMVDLVQQWSDEHPQKTYADVFFEKFPNAKKLNDQPGVPAICPSDLGFTDIESCGGYCYACWHQVYEEKE